MGLVKSRGDGHLGCRVPQSLSGTSTITSRRDAHHYVHDSFVPLLGIVKTWLLQKDQKALFAQSELFCPFNC